MGLTTTEQWQLIGWLLSKKSTGSLDKCECFALHHLLLARVGENYQQIMCEPPDDLSQAEILVSIGADPGQLEIRETERQSVLAPTSADEDTARNAVYRLLQSPNIACEVFSADYMQSLLQRLTKELSERRPFVAQPLSTVSAQSTCRGRKWKKFRRDPALFFTDFCRKILKL